jgi:hypothetical protein
MVAGLEVTRWISIWFYTFLSTKSESFGLFLCTCVLVLLVELTRCFPITLVPSPEAVAGSAFDCRVKLGFGVLGLLG